MIGSLYNERRVKELEEANVALRAEISDTMNSVSIVVADQQAEILALRAAAQKAHDEMGEYPETWGCSARGALAEALTGEAPLSRQPVESAVSKTTGMRPEVVGGAPGTLLVELTHKGDKIQVFAVSEEDYKSRFGTNVLADGEKGAGAISPAAIGQIGEAVAGGEKGASRCPTCGSFSRDFRSIDISYEKVTRCSDPWHGGGE